MNRRASFGVVAAFWLGLVFGGNSIVNGASVVYSPPKLDEVRTRILESLIEFDVTPCSGIRS